MDRLTKDDRGTFDVETEHSRYRFTVADHATFLTRHRVHALASDMGERDQTMVPCVLMDDIVMGQPAHLRLRFEVGVGGEPNEPGYIWTDRVTTLVLGISRVTPDWG